ncbi:unnamed protein product [Blepharisma stoltei]|uniref:C2H2-type domain-containing protein n=1 Tax=Blepharisma stoltei TaxID=1481888 RepID=A0AAU9K312_9CILI|nr:unnamed protein product [Blepharisma stoltei]
MMENQFKCYYTNCTKSYRTKYNLRRHINAIHLKIRNFVCAECSKTFACKQNLNEHELLHRKDAKSSKHERTIIKNPQAKSIENKSIVTPFELLFINQEVSIRNLNSRSMAGPMPVLPPVDKHRQSDWGQTRIPILHSLLNNNL